jgi:hypothetical protein
VAQYLRPDSNITQNGVTGGFADIDETTASDTDYAYSADNTAGTLEVGLSNPSGTPSSGTCTARYRLANIDGGVLGSGGNAVTITPTLYQGGSLIASGTDVTAPDAWTTYNFTFNTSSVTDWTDLRLRWSCNNTGGAVPARRGMGISWAEVEAPDAPSPITLTVENLAQVQALTSPVLMAGLPVQVGATTISSVYLGSTQITAAYKGSTQLW